MASPAASADKRRHLFHFLPLYLTQSFLGWLSIRLSLSLSEYMC